MASTTMSLFLTLFCQICFTSAFRSVQVHPKFVQTRKCVPYFCDYFTGLPRTDWIPSLPTVMYQLMRDTNYPLAIAVTIEDIPRNEEKLGMKFKYRCSPSDTEVVQDMMHPFKFKSTDIICTSALPISIRTEVSDWISDTTYKLKLIVSFTRASKVSFNDALTHNMRIQLEFTGTNWRLESNGLFLRNWDSLYQHNNQPDIGKYYTRYYLTKDAIELMRFMNFTESSHFVTKEFIAPEVTRLIQSAPEYVKETIAIGALLLINAIRCTPSMERVMAFMSKHYVRHYEHESVKVMHIDSDTGYIHFSNQGLKALASKTTTETRPLTGVCADTGHGTCSFDLICSWLELGIGAATYSYVGRKDIIRVYRPDNPYKKAMTTTTSTVICNSSSIIVATNKVRIFTRASFTNIKCPIVCNSVDAKYAFYKGDKLLQPLPNNNNDDAVLVHKSGAVLLFNDFATHKDSGEYKCTAHGAEYKFLVEIVALPLFSIVGTELVGGELPPRIYARIGYDYSANCTVFYSGMKSVTITPEFYVVLDKTSRVWSKLTEAEFIERLKLVNSKAKITVSSTTFSTTLALTVSNVPLPTAAFDLSHRFVCNAAASADDMLRYGVSEYNVQSGSDVLIVPPPKAADFEAKMSSCCAEKCSGKKCVIEYSLKSEVLKRIRSMGLDVRGTFKIGSRSLSSEENKSVTYDTNIASLKYETDKGFMEMTDAEKQSFLQLTPVFETFLPSGSGNVMSAKTMASANGNAPCDKDPSCYYSMESDKPLSELLRIGAKFELDTLEKFEKLFEDLQFSKHNSIITPWSLLVAILSLCSVAIFYLSCG